MTSRDNLLEKSDLHQGLMDKAYTRWQKGDLKSKDLDGFYAGLQDPERLAVVLGNLNYQIGNGGVSQWIFNGYADASIEYLEEYCNKYSSKYPSFKKLSDLLDELVGMKDDEGFDSFIELVDSKENKKEKLRDAIESEDWNEVYDLLGVTDLDKRSFQRYVDDKVNGLSYAVVETGDGQWKWELENNKGDVLLTSEETFSSKEEAEEDYDASSISAEDLDEDERTRIEDEVKEELFDEYSEHISGFSSSEDNAMSRRYYSFNNALLEDIEDILDTEYTTTSEKAVKMLKSFWSKVAGSEPLGKEVEKAGDQVLKKVTGAAKSAYSAASKTVSNIPTAVRDVKAGFSKAGKSLRGESVEKFVDNMLTED